MIRPCCVGERTSRGLAGRLSKAAASIVPGALLVLLPKCPLCLAAWLTVATGAGFSAAGAAWVRGMILLFWVAALALVATPIIRRRSRRKQERPAPRTEQAGLETTELSGSYVRPGTYWFRAP